MLRAAYYGSQDELIVDGRREDYNLLVSAARQVLSSGVETAVSVESIGPLPITDFVIRQGAVPNRINFEGGHIVISIALTQEEQFLSFIQFPDDRDLPKSGIQYHHHYDPSTDDGTYIARDSIPVVFALESRPSQSAVEAVLSQLDTIPTAQSQGFELWIPQRLTLRGQSAPADVAGAVILDKILGMGFEPDGFSEADGGRVYRYRKMT